MNHFINKIMSNYWWTVNNEFTKFGNFIWLQLIFGQKSCFLGPSQLGRQKVNIHYYTYNIYFYSSFLITDLGRWNNYCRCTFIHHQIWKIHSGDTCQSSSQLYALESCSRLNEIFNRQGQKNITEIFAKTHRKVGRNTKV